MLVYRNQSLGVIEAKRRDAPDTEGLGQAKGYAERMHVRFAYATNGRRIYQVDMQTGTEDYIDAYPTPDQLWQATFGHRMDNDRYWHERFSSIAFVDKGGHWQPRYYQYNAVNRALDAIAEGRDRILLTLATGTGKTAIAFQIAWKLFHTRWNITDRNAELTGGRRPSRRPRILFLADRNILADQAFNDFSAFPEDALARIRPADIRRQGRVPKNASVFFTIFQTFVAGYDEAGNPSPYFGEYPQDFFDFIVIDECHRGGANDESTWRAILEYFYPAVQLGLTATPKRKQNVDTYGYFGEPVYVYSLVEGINDGYLTPFRIKQISTTLDDYVYTPDDTVLEGEVQEGRRYREIDFNRIIEIRERERKRVQIFMDDIDQRQKTLVFCATQEHALAVRDLINQLKKSTAPNYCVRVTADEGARGEQWLRTFRDNEKTIPTILTTSHKLSTGVDARNVRNIVLMRPINSVIEFKQIVGRGTRLFEGKDYFTIYDFVRAYEHFNDPEWDGPPEAPEPKPDPDPQPPGPEPPEGPPDNPGPPRQKVRIKLADGKERTIQHMTRTCFYGPDGKPLTAAQFIERLYGELPDLFKDEAELRRLWSRPDTRARLLGGLEDRGYGKTQLADLSKLIDAEKSDLYDVLAYIAFEQAPITREARVAAHRMDIFARYGDEKQREFLEFVLGHYVGQGVGELDQDKLPGLLELKYHGLQDAIAALGAASEIRKLFVGFQRHLYDERAA